ncbi:MAG TPA: response regulator [Candidatus Dormibacteraeota bacterium]|nr:response regulator [Candidatus Dormibacteraeota bacterium]
MPHKRKKILFVDDEASLLDLIRQLMTHFSGGAWEVLTALDVSKALSLLQEHRVDLLVLDIHMPLVDGLQFLSLLQRKYPNVLKVMLTGDANDSHRAACLAGGAELFLEKPRDEGGWRTVYATLHELTRFQPEEGFRGVLRRVGLQDVLQMECLARNSSILKIHAANIHGLVYVKEGQIIHAQCGERTGEEAFNYLLGLAGGEFDVTTFADPPSRSITGSWEFLLMEAARKRDETGPVTPGQSDSGFQTPATTLSERPTPNVVPVIEAGQTTAQPVRPQSQLSLPTGTKPQVAEFLVCSLQGEVLHEWQCSNPNGRVSFLEFLAQKARQLTQGMPLGDFDRLEVNGPDGRVVAQIQSDRALLVRTRPAPLEEAAAPGPNPVSP